MKRIASGSMGCALFAVALSFALVGCGETTNDSGTGGDAGTGGGVGDAGGDGGDGGTGGMSSRTADETCRAWCANEPQNFSCFGGPIQAVADCYRSCSVVYEAENDRQCGDEWIATLDCEVELDCNDLFDDCRPQRLAYDDCVRIGDARIWCEANCPEFDIDECAADTSECSALRYCETACPTQDQEDCVEERLTLGTCSTAGATTACRQYCTTQDLAECVDQWIAMSQCEFDSPEGICEFVCPDVGASLGYCIAYYDENGVCPDGPPPPLTCVEPSYMCQNGAIDSITPTCSLPAPPSQADGCAGDESVINPSSCTPTGTMVTYQLTAMEVLGDCNVGYDLDGCDGNSCILGGLASGEGVAGADNALAGLAPVLAGVGGNIGGVDQAFHDAICAGQIDIELVIDVNAGENCATVQILSGGSPVDGVLLNRSDSGCVSGQLGSLPLNVAGVPGTLMNAVVRMTVSASGFSDGLLGGTADQATAGSIADELIDGGSAVVGQVLDINADLEGNLDNGCDSLSMTLSIGGAAVP